MDGRHFWCWHTLVHLGAHLEESTPAIDLYATLDRVVAALPRKRVLVYDCSDLSAARLMDLLALWSTMRLRYQGKLGCQMRLPPDWQRALRFADASKLLRHVRNMVMTIS